jgi:hypothetical protein
MTVLPFNIFTGCFGDKDVVWRGAFEGLVGARDRMLQIAAKQPGAYFVFSSDSQLIVAVVDTTPKSKAKGPA